VHAWLQGGTFADLQPQQPLPRASEDKSVMLVRRLSIDTEGSKTASVTLLSRCLTFKALHLDLEVPVGS